MLKINDTSLPAPQTLSVSAAPAGGTGARNTLGQLVRDTLGEKRTVTATWRRMSQSSLAALFTLIEGEDSFSLSYPDPTLGETTIACFCRARGAALERRENGADTWRDVTVTFEER